jgi:hypothetical protein
MANPRKEITGSRQRTFEEACPANYVWILQHPSCRVAVGKQRSVPPRASQPSAQRQQRLPNEW